ncbi:eCIS core domain-containing protein [Coleofasciculus sp. G2-EDA-02]|uniref:eCIS core domain-containing protein n=1 Tax=Coleofasciculus sp. G2-EDA-02 TaxID=3069529 RepID=UPI0032FCC980
MSDRELQKGLVQDNIKYSQVELGRLVMGSRRRLNKKTSWESTSLPVRNPLQPRPFGKGIQARRAELPTTNVLQTRPFGTPKQASTPRQEMTDLQAQLKQAESFGYNAANIPTVPSSSATPIQAKLTIGEPNDKYEQEADQVASQVVNQINSPQSQPSVQGKTVQRETLPPEEEEEETPVSAKLESGTLQREALPPEEEEEGTPVSAKLESGTLQRETLPPEEEEETPVSAKLESDTIQRQGISPEEEEKKKISPKLMRKSQSGTGSTNASVNLEESIQQKRGQGQALSEDIREPMEQAFGADFSGVKVHTDSQSDQLNHSIQARAFTTGSDVFFKQGEYNPGSKDGQELIAHELTHVVQQTGTVQRDDDPAKKDKKKSKSTIEELRDALGGWGADSDKILQLLGKASASEKKQILADSKLMGQLQSKLSRREMIQALNALEAPLKQKLNAAMKGWGCDAQLIKDLTASAKDAEKKAVLADTALVNRLSSELSRADMLTVLGNLNAPLRDKLNAAMDGWGVDAEAIKTLTQAASDAEKQGILNDAALVSRLSSELSRADMLVILGNLNAPLKNKLRVAMSGWGADTQAIRTLINNADVAQKQAVLADVAFLRSMLAELSWDDFAKSVELLGRQAPTANELLANGNVQSALGAAWTDSQVNDPTNRHEEGGWIYLNLVTGEISTRRAPAGAQARLDLGNPPQVDESIVVGDFHTHPNPTSQGWQPRPSTQDHAHGAWAGVPGLVRSDIGDFTFGPNQRLHLAGNRGFPGSSGGVAPQARKDGSYDEI